MRRGLIFVFALAAGVLSLYVYAATYTKIWDTAADFNTGSLSNTVVTSDGFVQLAQTPTSASKITLQSGVYKITSRPNQMEFATKGSRGVTYYWLDHSSKNVDPLENADPYSGTVHKYRTIDTWERPEWWAAFQFKVPSETPWTTTGFGSQSWNTYINIHAEGSSGDGPCGGAGWGFAFVSPVRIQLNGAPVSGKTPFSLILMDSPTGGSGTTYQLPPVSQGQWHSVLMRVRFGLATSVTQTFKNLNGQSWAGSGRQPGLIQIWLDDNIANAPTGTPDFQLLNTTTLRWGTPSAWRSDSCGQDNNYYVQRLVTWYDGGMYAASQSGINAPKDSTTATTANFFMRAAQLGQTLNDALTEYPVTLLSTGRHSYYDTVGSPNLGNTSYSVVSTSDSVNYPPPFPAPGSTSGYVSSGTITLSFDAGKTVDWTTLAALDTKPTGTSITYETRSSSDKTSWSSWQQGITNTPHGRYLETRATLTTSSSASTPRIDRITVEYADATTATTTTTIFGKNTIGASFAGLGSNFNRVSKFSLGQRADVTKLSVYLKGSGTAGSQVIKGVIYDDLNGLPNKLKGVTNELTISGTDAPAWRDLPFASPVRLEAGNYWLGIISGETTLIAQISVDSKLDALRVIDDLYSDGPVATFSSPRTANLELSIYATYTVPTFTTNITDGMTILTPFSWTFDPGEPSVKGYFWADGQLLATVDGSGPYTYVLPIGKLTNGTHTLGHAWDTATGVHKSPPSSYSVTIKNGLPCSGRGTNNFYGCYYDNINLTNLKLTRTDASINFDWGTGSPDPSIAPDTFSVRWQGSFTFESAEYEFVLTSDDGIRLWIDNALVLDKWLDQPPTTYTVTRTIPQGPHIITVDYYERGGGATVAVSWRKKSAF